jgi:NAD+ kinase
VCADKASTDWFGSVSRTLRWNEREKQKSFVVVEEDTEPSHDAKRQGKKSSSEAKKKVAEANKELKEEDEEDEDEDDYDIDE